MDCRLSRPLLSPFCKGCVISFRAAEGLSNGENRRNLVRENKSSSRLWIGVPVRHQRLSASKASIALKVSVEEFRISCASSRTMDILVAHGADVTAGNCFGNTPLHELWKAAKYKAWTEDTADCVRKISALFIRNGADLSAKNKDGHEIRDIAESFGSLAVREALGIISLLKASDQT